jgi:hypothetical protein
MLTNHPMLTVFMTPVTSVVEIPQSSCINHSESKLEMFTSFVLVNARLGYLELCFPI